MSTVRERISEYPRGTAAVMGTIIVVACIFMVKSRGAGKSVPAFESKSFYTCDDGVTLFPDDINKIPPFDHNGQQAVAARVLASRGGRQQWVQYLAKYNDETRRKLDSPHADSAKAATGPAGLLVKKPGAGDWVPMMSPDGMQIIKIQVPNGVPPESVEEARP